MKINTQLILKDYEGTPLTHSEEDGVEDKEVGGKIIKVPKMKKVDTTLKYILMIAATSFAENEILTAEIKSKLHVS